jgi:hypothetical protein
VQFSFFCFPVFLTIARSPFQLIKYPFRMSLSNKNRISLMGTSGRKPGEPRRSVGGMGEEWVSGHEK